MRTEESGSDRTACSGPRGAGEPPPPTSRPLHPRSFKLRFATQREPGRSYVSLVKPLGLPATVTGKFYSREEPASMDEAATRRALRGIRDMATRGPRDRHPAPVTSSQVYGWHDASDAGGLARDRRFDHRIRDSAWLKERLCVLAADDKLKQR